MTTGRRPQPLHPRAYVEAVRRQPDKMGSRIQRNAEGLEFDV
jgi:hypothetical protein